MKPLRDYLLVGEVKEDLKTESGIVLTQSVTSGNKHGKIIAVGPDVSEDLKVGQHIICEWKESTPVQVEGIMMVLLKEESVAAISKDVE